MIADEGLACFGGVIGGDRVEGCRGFPRLHGGQDAGGDERGGVGLAGGDFLREKPPVEDDGALPAFEVGVERFAEAAGPHFYGLLFVGH